MPKVDKTLCENCNAPRSSDHVCSTVREYTCVFCPKVFDDFSALHDHIYDEHPDPRQLDVKVKPKARAGSTSPLAFKTSPYARRSNPPFKSSPSASSSSSLLSSSSGMNSSTSSIGDHLQPYNDPNVQYELSHMKPTECIIEGDFLQKSLNRVSWKNETNPACSACHVYGKESRGHPTYREGQGYCSTIKKIMNDLSIFRSGLNFRQSNMCYTCGISLKMGETYHDDGRLTRVHPFCTPGKYCHWRDTVYIYLFWGLGPNPNATVLKLINSSKHTHGLDFLNSTMGDRLKWLSGTFNKDQDFLKASPILIALDAVWKVKGYPPSD